MRAKPPREIREAIIVALAERDGYACYICPKVFADNSEVTIDHFYPLSKGGSWHIDNLRLACQPCNNKKGDAEPNPDGTVNFLPRNLKVPKAPRPEICNKCNSGRALQAGESCDICGSLPQPLQWPNFKKKIPKNCDHNIYHCWMCVAGFVDRKPVVNDLLGE